MSEFFLPAESAGVVDLLVRATILLCVGMVLQWLFRKWPAATRHRLWTLTFVLLLALPALRQFGPSWDLPLLPDANRPSDAARRLEVANSLVPADAGVTAAPLASLVLDVSFGRGGAAEAPLLRPWTLWVFVFWAAGCALAFASLGVGARRFSRLVRAGQPVEDEAWLSQLDALRKRLSIRVKVRLVLAVEPLTPMTGGVCHPVILLPASASHWPEARRHAVLAHELVHVHRRDALRQLIGRAVLALYWFHPLGWVASHLAAARREEACDEEVLAIGARPSDYARHILSLAESGFLRRPALSLPMAQQSQLERRIRAILSPHRPRPRALVAAVALVAAAVGGVSVSIANPTRLGDAPGVVGEDAGMEASALDCVPASDADGLSGWDFAAGLGPVLVCTIQGEAVPTISDGVRAIEPFLRAAVEKQIRKQLEGAVYEEGMAGPRRKTR